MVDFGVVLFPLEGNVTSLLSPHAQQIQCDVSVLVVELRFIFILLVLMGFSLISPIGVSV